MEGMHGDAKEFALDLSEDITKDFTKFSDALKEEFPYKKCVRTRKEIIDMLKNLK